MYNNNSDVTVPTGQKGKSDYVWVPGKEKKNAGDPSSGWVGGNKNCACFAPSYELTRGPPELVQHFRL